MDGEFGGFTVHGGWLVFLALAALWIALAIESRTRRLTSLLEAAIKEAEQLREANAKPGGGPEGEALRSDLGQLATAVDPRVQGECQQPGRASAAEAVHPGREAG